MKDEEIFPLVRDALHLADGLMNVRGLVVMDQLGYGGTGAGAVAAAQLALALTQSRELTAALTTLATAELARLSDTTDVEEPVAV